ncbi:helix-turn-helix domain-containing protein [Streptacidiphilus sp. MAP5-3]|uniref:helix-turn-helix domain-containing protein n=1 Tax=unclassified Streptacidiphilus TaxID=2643834 RepID=UPI0035176143
MTAETRMTLSEAKKARAASPIVQEAYAAARLRFELGEAVRRRRAELGISQSELGRRADMTQSAVARFEAGGAVPTLPLLDRLAEALGLELRVEFVEHAKSA